MRQLVTNNPLWSGEGETGASGLIELWALLSVGYDLHPFHETDFSLFKNRNSQLIITLHF